MLKALDCEKRKDKDGDAPLFCTLNFDQELYASVCGKCGEVSRKNREVLCFATRRDECIDAATVPLPSVNVGIDPASYRRSCRLRGMETSIWSANRQKHLRASFWQADCVGFLAPGQCEVSDAPK